jgi:hypothetical protein
MSIFEEVVLSWDGVEYKIDPERVMGAIAKVEEIITLRELSEYAQKGDAPMAKLAMAFASVLRYAGAKVRDEEVYSGMFSGSGQKSAIGSISVLLQMMIPPSALKMGNDQAAPTGGKNSSKKPTK